MFKKVTIALLATTLLGCSTTSTAANLVAAPAVKVTSAEKNLNAGDDLKIVGNFKPGVDPRLMDAMSHAVRQFCHENPGFSVQAFSGYRAGDPRQHGKRMAVDVEIVDPSGHVMPNYQNAKSFRTYEKLAQIYHGYIDLYYPELKGKDRWGGYFAGKSNYGAVDLMHFDLGGLSGLGMAGGSWEHGLTKSQRALFPDVVSVGLGK